MSEIKKSKMLNYIKACIKNVEDKFKDNPNYFIDGQEEDIVVYLYHLIAKDDTFTNGIDYQLKDGEWIKTQSIHAQAKTYTKVKKRTGRFDLGIINPDQKNAKYDYLVAIEMKWITTIDLKLDAGKTNFKKIKEDIKKINNKGNDVENGFLLIFNSQNRFTKTFKRKINSCNKNKRLKIKFIAVCKNG